VCAFSRTVPVTQSHMIGRHHLRPTFNPAPVGVACWRPIGRWSGFSSRQASSDDTGTSRWSWRAICGQKSATGVARHRPGERETIGSVATRALTEDSVEMEFLTDDPVAQAVTYQRVTLEARAPRCGRYGCATAGRVNWT
jgi:hypothetical protein